MVTYEVSDAGREYIEKLKTFGSVEKLDSSTVNVTVDDENADDVSEWLEQQKLQHRMV